MARPLLESFPLPFPRSAYRTHYIPHIYGLLNTKLQHMVVFQGLLKTQGVGDIDSFDKK